jgi:tetratricopeptide (TPR) repeat protein
MLKSRDTLGFSPIQSKSRTEQQLGYLFLGLYALMSLFWAFSADAPWDDDCPTRFLNTRNALSDPLQFISVWNRPLWVLIFALPAQMGKVSVPLLMTLLSTLGAGLLWRAVEKLNVPQAWLIIPLYVFQPFFFGTSRVALTEPLAATLICAGFYFLVHRKWVLYALMGGLLPLARLELSLLLILWLIPLAKERQWRAIFVMAAPIVAWNLVGGILTGDFNYVFHQTFGLDKGINRYGQTTFLHYFERYWYVTGPVVAMLFSLGIAYRVRYKSVTSWIDGQFLLGFLVYVLFSWKLSMGNAAGFLRNLVPLSPLAALIALDGWNQVWATLAKTKYGNQLQRLKNDQLLASLTILVTLGITFAFFSKTLVLHQILDPQPNYLLLLFMLISVVLGVIWTQVKLKTSESIRQMSVALTLAGLSVSYTLISEPPTASANVERQAVGTIATYFKHSEFAGREAYVNHNWFFWSADLDAYDPKYKRVTMDNLTKAPKGALVVWDSHYSTRLSGDVYPSYFEQHPEFVELLRVGHPDLKECVILYEKLGAGSLERVARSASFGAENARFLPAIAARAHFLMAQHDYRNAIDRFDFILGNVQNDPGVWYGRGLCMMETGYYTEAIANFKNAVTLEARLPLAWYQLGVAQARTGDLKSALISLNRSLALENASETLYHTRAAVKTDMGDLHGAIADYSLAIRLNPQNLQAYSDRAMAHALAKQLPQARADIAKVLAEKPQDPQAIFVKGRIELQAGDKEKGCALMQNALELGLQEAQQFITKNCGATVDTVLSNPAR